MSTPTTVSSRTSARTPNREMRFIAFVWGEGLGWIALPCGTSYGTVRHPTRARCEAVRVAPLP